MPLYLSYIVFKEPGRKLGHASLAITKYDPGDPVSTPKMIFRIGLLRPSQVQLEDFIKAKKNREFFHKTYPITEEEMSKILVTLNQDRRISPKQDAKLREESKSRKPGSPSIPHGPEHNWVTFNCKTYALSVMEKAGIRDISIENFGVDIPVASGIMHPLEFKEDDNSSLILSWNKECFIVEKRPGMKVEVEIKDKKISFEEEQKTKGIFPEEERKFSEKKINIEEERILNKLEGEVEKYLAYLCDELQPILISKEAKTNVQDIDLHSTKELEKFITYLEYRQKLQGEKKDISIDIIIDKLKKSKELKQILSDHKKIPTEKLAAFRQKLNGFKQEIVKGKSEGKEMGFAKHHNQWDNFIKVTLAIFATITVVPAVIYSCRSFFKGKGLFTLYKPSSTKGEELLENSDKILKEYGSHRRTSRTGR